MNNMVGKQMRSVILEIGSLWYSALVDAGQPELKNLIKIKLESEYKKEEEDAEKKYQKGKVIGKKFKQKKVSNISSPFFNPYIIS